MATFPVSRYYNLVNLYYKAVLSNENQIWNRRDQRLHILVKWWKSCVDQNLYTHVAHLVFIECHEISLSSHSMRSMFSKLNNLYRGWAHNSTCNSCTKPALYSWSPANSNLYYNLPLKFSFVLELPSRRTRVSRTSGRTFSVALSIILLNK